MNDESITTDIQGVCAVVITYNPLFQLLDNLTALAQQVGEVVIIDNGSGAEGQRILAEALKLGPISVLHSSVNVGIAAALNKGVRFARERGYFWVATFDQDSTVPEVFIERMLSVWADCPFRRSVPLVAPRYEDRHTGKISSYAGSYEGPYAEVITTMTSGNLVQTAVFDRVGFFAEEFFIDCVDHEFCLRLRSNGYRAIEVRDALLLHSLGHMTVHRACGKDFKVFNHIPLRRYYNARNRIALYRRYGLRFPRWLLKDVTDFAREVAGILLFESDSRAKVTAIVRGVSDGLQGKAGKYGGHL